MKTSIPLALAAQTLSGGNQQKVKQAEEKIIRIRSNRSRKGKAFLASVFLVAYGLCGSVHAFTILAGTDYFTTVGGEFDFNKMDIPGIEDDVDIDPFSVVTRGPRFGPGNTTTVITRLENATVANDPGLFSFDTVAVQLSELVLLQSAEPVKINGKPFNVHFTFTPLPQQDGAFKIQHEFGEPGGGFVGGGVFDSVPIPVNLDVTFTPTIGGPGVPIPTQRVNLELNVPDRGGADHFWETEPEPGDVIVTGKPGNLSANRHIPLNGLFDFFPDETDGFPWRIFVTVPADQTIGFFDLQSASVPDEGPGIVGAFLLMGTCIGSQVWRRRFTRSNA
jgi:hypothetical protein